MDACFDIIRVNCQKKEEKHKYCIQKEIIKYDGKVPVKKKKKKRSSEVPSFL
jgi:hypothetical protein